MAKPKQGSNRTGAAKRGKRHQYKAPAVPNEDRLAAREAGLQQFNLTAPATVTVADRLGKLRAVTVPYAWDAARKHILFSPGKGDQK